MCTSPGSAPSPPAGPCPSPRLDSVLGKLDKLPPKLAAWVERMKPIMEGLLGVQYCHYALDPETRQPTDTAVSMSVKSAHSALEMAGLAPTDIDLLVYAGITMENFCPPTTTLIQEELKIPRVAEYAIHSNCTSVYKAIQLAADQLAMGRYKHALICQRATVVAVPAGRVLQPGRAGEVAHPATVVSQRRRRGAGVEQRPRGGSPAAVPRDAHVHRIHWPRPRTRHVLCDGRPSRQPARSLRARLAPPHAELRAGGAAVGRTGQKSRRHDDGTHRPRLAAAQVFLSSTCRRGTSWTRSRPTCAATNRFRT